MIYSAKTLITLNAIFSFIRTQSIELFFNVAKKADENFCFEQILRERYCLYVVSFGFAKID